MKRQALMHRLLLLSMLMYLLNACVPYAPSPRDFRPSRLSCDELQGLQEMFQPYWGKQLTEEDVKTIVQSRYRISEEQFKNRGFNEFDGELWWMSWPLDDIGITVFTDAQDILVRVGIGWHSYAETALTPIIRPGELAQCLGTEPEWYHAGMRQHFECGIQYQYTTYYPQIGLTAEGSGCVSYNTLPPPVTQDSPYNGLILVHWTFDKTTFAPM